MLRSCASRCVRRRRTSDDFANGRSPAHGGDTQKGISLGQLVRPLESVGCYVPGGRYPLVSTVLMTVIPAQVAGVKNIRVVSPNPSAEVLGAAAMLGVTRVLPRGRSAGDRSAGLWHEEHSASGQDRRTRQCVRHRWRRSWWRLTARLIFSRVRPRRLILSDSGNPEFIAADLVAQAEHDADALAVVRYHVSQVGPFGRRKRDPTCSRKSDRRRYLCEGMARYWLRPLAERRVSGRTCLLRNTSPSLRKICRSFENAGSVFVGDYSAQAAGDYASGPNHVLPTSGQARFRGGLSVLDFVKIITVQQTFGRRAAADRTGDRMSRRSGRTCLRMRIRSA